MKKKARNKSKAVGKSKAPAKRGPAGHRGRFNQLLDDAVLGVKK